MRRRSVGDKVLRVEGWAAVTNFRVDSVLLLVNASLLLAGIAASRTVAPRD
jgi:hypothetical protein